MSREGLSQTTGGHERRERIPAMPTHVQIQTITSCATLCHFCPNSSLPRTATRQMAPDLFSFLCREFREYPPEYAALYLMADPLTDPLIFERLREFRDACPETWIELSTKGELLTPAAIEGLLRSPLNELRVNFPSIDRREYARHAVGADYDLALANVKRLGEALQAEKDPSLRTEVVALSGWSPRDSIEATAAFWHAHNLAVTTWPAVSRAGNVAALVPARNRVLAGCSQGRATHWMHIGWDGRLVLCCMDYRRQVELGTVFQGVNSAWQSPAYAEVRRVVDGRAGVRSDGDFPCNRCEWNGAWEGRRAEVAGSGHPDRS